VEEIRGFNQRIEEGKGIPDHDKPECFCQFFRRYLLLCKHLFHRNLHGDFLTDEDWASFQHMFAESGFNVYISRMRVFEEREEDPVAVEAEEQRLQFYAAMEEVRERRFELEARYRADRRCWASE
jgi:hypothetical protein